MNKTFTNKAGNLILELRQESMSAWLTIKKTGKLIGEHEILSLIDETGIKTGFDEALRYIRENRLEKEYDVPFPIAICNIAESSSILRYHFNPDLQLNFTQGVFFPDLVRISYVHAGEPIADYSNNLFEQGGSIYDIFGELIQPGSVDTEQAQSLAGANVHYDAPNREFIADKTGYPYLDELGRLCLLDVIVVKGEDIPSDTTISIPIDLVVQGNLVCADLECSASLTVQGDLHSSQVCISKDLRVEGDIIACNGNGVQVWGKISCNGITDSRVLGKQLLRFNGIIENSFVACDGDVTGNQISSQICGGTTQAGGSFSIAKAGNRNGQPTVIEIAISPFYRALLMQMTRSLVRLKADSEGNALLITELQSKIKSCEAGLDEQLNTFLARPAEVRKSVQIHSEILPATQIRVLKHTYSITNPEKGREYVEKD